MGPAFESQRNHFYKTLITNNIISVFSSKAAALNKKNCISTNIFEQNCIVELYSSLFTMATIRLTVLNSIKESNGKLPILICISQKKDRAYIKTEFLLDDISEFEDGRVVYRKDAGIINKRIQFVFSQYKEKYDSIADLEFLSASQIKYVITAKERPPYISFIEYWKKRIADFRKDGRESYAKMNEDTIKLFIKAEGDIPIPAINYKIVEHFNKWMITHEYADGNIGIRLTHLKARINELIRESVLKVEVHPFAYTKIPSATPKECDLSIEEFRKILNADFTGKELNLARDMFLLSFYLCGINLKDLLSVHFDNSNYLSFERSKTSRSKRGDSRLTIPIHAVAAQIIDKYLKKGKIDLGYSFSYQNLQRFINRGMKKMRKSLEINSTVCFYSARKTFAQFASELGIPDGVIDYCLGHSDKSRGVIRYYTKVKQKQAEIAINRVIDYVNNPEKYKDYIEMKADIMMMKG